MCASLLQAVLWAGRVNPFWSYYGRARRHGALGREGSHLVGVKLHKAGPASSEKRGRELTGIGLWIFWGHYLSVTSTPLPWSSLCSPCCPHFGGSEDELDGSASPGSEGWVCMVTSHIGEKSSQCSYSGSFTGNCQMQRECLYFLRGRMDFKSKT